MTPAQLLDFERTHPKHNGWKEEAIRRELGINPARYYALLDRAARSLEGWEHDPFTADRVTMRAWSRPSATRTTANATG